MSVPLSAGGPFIISVFHGSTKPDIESFFQPFLDEIVKLSPYRDDYDPDHPPPFVVTISCIICDSPMRSWMQGNGQGGRTYIINNTTLCLYHLMIFWVIYISYYVLTLFSGTGGHTAYLACTRCKCVGETAQGSRGGGGVFYPDLDAPLRHDAEWHLYAQPEVTINNIEKSLVVRKTPFTELKGFGMVS